MNERPMEYSFALRMVTKYAPSTALDVGTGRTAFPDLLKTCEIKTLATDKKVKHSNPFCNVHKYNVVKGQLGTKYDMIFCISVLEHIVKYDAAIGNMMAMLSAEGVLVLTVPFTCLEYVDNVYKLPTASYDRGLCHAFTDKNVEDWTHRNNAKINDSEFWNVFTGQYWASGERLKYPFVDKNGCHLACLAIQKG